jgi:uncharacterized protein YciI
MAYYAVVRIQTWERTRPMEEQPHWDEHAGFMDNLVDEGVIVLGGPLDGGPNVLLVFAAESEEEVLARLEEDVWTRTGQLRTESILPWQIRLGEIVSRTPSAPRS